VSAGEKVAIVVDEDYSGLAELASLMAVWVVDTPANRQVMERLWKQRESSGSDLTLFKSTSGLSKEVQIVGQIWAIEMHFPDVDSLLLIGISGTSSLRDSLEKLGYSLEESSDGMLARKFGELTTQ
jgi:hypothetical protein